VIALTVDGERDEPEERLAEPDRPRPDLGEVIAQRAEPLGGFRFD
jgi:hypothetical protein